MADILQRQRELRERQLKAQAAQQKSQQVSKRAQSQAEIEKFKAENVQLDTGEWISKAEFEKLSPEDQARLKKLGIKGFNDYYQKAESDFKANNVQIKDGWISKAAYESLSPEDQQRIKELGIEGFNKYYEQKQAEFERNNVKLNTGEYVSKTEYNNLPSEWQSALKTYGVGGFQNWLSTAYPGAKGFIVIDDPNAGKMVYGKTDDPNIGIDAGGNRIWIGGRWPDAVKHYLQGVEISSRWPEDVKTFLQGVEIRGSEIISREQLQAEKLAEAQKVKPKVSTIKTAGEAKPVSDLIKIGKDQYMDKEAFNALDIKYQNVLKTEGVEAFQKEYAKDHVKLDDGTYISNATWAHLSKEDQELANKEGYEAVLKKNTVELKSGELVDKAEFESLPPAMQKVAKEQGLDAIDLSKLKPEQQFEKMKEWKLVDKDAEFAGVDETGQILIKGKEADIPWTEKYLSSQMAKDLAIGMIPIAGTIYRWERMEPWDKGLSIALDMMAFIPFTSAVSAGVRGGGKLTAVIGRAALAEAKAPITAIMHPVATVKGIARPVQTLLGAKKVPLTAAEIRSSTIFFDPEDIGTAKDAMQARDIITKKAIMGDKPAVEIAGKKIELSKVALNQTTEPLGVHTGYDMRPFLNGADIQTSKEGYGLFISSSLHSNATPASLLGHGLTPAPEVSMWEFGQKTVDKIGKYHPQEILRLDKPAIRSLNFADATDIPNDLARPMKQIVQEENGILFGSFAEHLKLPKAKVPHDADLGFANPDRARERLIQMSKSHGYNAVQVGEAVGVITKGKYAKMPQKIFDQTIAKDKNILKQLEESGEMVKIADVKGMDRINEFYELHGLKSAGYDIVDGIRVTKLGEQYLRQAFGATDVTLELAKHTKRVKRVKFMSKELAELISDAGLTQKMPGALLIRDEKILKTMQPSGKITRYGTEIEETIPGGNLPAPSQILETYDAAGNTLYLLVIGKPFTQAEIAKFKLMGSVDLIRDIFRPALKIDGKAVDTMTEVNRLAAESRQLENAIKAADKLGDLKRAEALRSQLAATTDRFRKLSRQADAAYAGRTAVRSAVVSTGDFIDRISFNDLARSKPVDFARTMNELPQGERARIMNDLEKPLRTRITREMEKITRTPAARAERKPLKTIEPERILRAETADRGTIKTDRERLPIEERAIVPGREPVTPVERQAVPVKESVPPRIDKSQIKTIISKIESESGKKTKVTGKQLEGAVAWKQGMFYRMHYPPFGAEDKLVTREPIPGVRYEEGIGSAAKSAVTLYGEVPQNIKLDMGIVDIGIGRADKTGKPKLKFKADPKQKTKYSGYVKDQSSIKISK